jgi:site-specific DNA-methyltransferase (adenine-specific)
VKYSVLVADPPWRFEDRLPGPGRGAEKHYDVLSTQDIENFELPDLADNCYLFLWRVSAMVEESYRVCRAWGFVPKTELVWIKRTKTGKRWFGMGHHLRAEHESCIVAVRGRPKPLVRNIRSTFEAEAGRHSAKPDEFYTLVQTLCEGPYVELFARRMRLGWTTLGNDPNLIPASEVG